MRNEELQNVQQEILESQSKYIELYDSAPVGYLTFNKAGIVVEANLTAANLLSVEKHHLANKPFIFFVEADFQSLFHHHLHKVFVNDMRQTCELKLIRENGASFYASVESIAIQGCNKNVQCRSIISDITGRKQMEKLQESSRILEALMEYIPEGIAIADASNATIRMVSNHGVRLIGRPQKIIDDVSLENHGEEWGIQRSDGIAIASSDELPLTRATQKGEVVLNEEWILCKPGREKITILCNAGPIRDRNGNIIYGVITWRDITEFKMAMDSSREKEASLVNAQRIACFGNWEWDLVKNKISWSEGLYRIFGLSPQSFDSTYEAFLERVHSDDREFVKESVHKALYEKAPYNIDYRIVLPDGSIRTIHAQGEVVRDHTGRLILMNGTVYDITERKQMEEALRKSEARLANAQRIAHIGNWEWDIIKNNVHWSDENYRIFNLPSLPPSLPPSPMKLFWSVFILMIENLLKNLSMRPSMKGSLMILTIVSFYQMALSVLSTRKVKLFSMVLVSLFK
ncbi:MAG: diguanylate cyclase/phosphodiesterase (GGDEF & EAL domains) with PAS/PAC sensor(s) [Candidatus Jettenia ecosi]|uniref:histidine kinase n=1 Tax=Candidatus Jettenia ecosi TaxID=2494326 RepID=A0A533Q8V8_9BACT|nr:MAG: diguanylate cyclase/phosphodiesterase (GGDEF & EAL domains) with PAS/PAC sensor(s) [Candidatus Jettenia ecosi]